MNREALIEATRKQMPEKRFRHVMGVVDTAVVLAERFGGDLDSSWLAALLHDYAKAWPTERMEKIIREQHLPPELLLYDKELWHAHVGAWAVQDELAIVDETVLDAIRYHTSGRAGMTLLDRIVCLADYMEPGRDFPGVNKIRKLAEHNLNAALIAGFDATITHLIDKGKRIFPLMIDARNDLIQQLKAEETSSSK